LTAMPNESSQRIPELDGLRGVAIMLVLIYHYVEIPPAAVDLVSKTLFGSTWLFYAYLPTRLMWSGVDLFFVLSGFLIGGILLDNRESARYYWVFYARRIHRIFPIYYLMVAFVTVGVWIWPLSPLFQGSMPMWAFIIYAQNLMGDYTKAPDSLEVTWSLAVEEQFYLIFPLIVKLCSRRVLVWLLGAIILGAPLFRALLIIRGFGFESVYPLLPARADSLALGVIAAIIVRSEESKNWIREHSKSLYLCLLGLFGLLPTLLKWTTYMYVGTLGYSILSVTYFLLIVLLLVTPFPMMKAIFSISWLRWLGKVSYCVYLIHHPVRIGLFMLFLPAIDPVIADPQSVLVTIFALGVTFAIAQISWWVIEKPLIGRAHVRYLY